MHYDLMELGSGLPYLMNMFPNRTTKLLINDSKNVDLTSRFNMSN